MNIRRIFLAPGAADHALAQTVLDAFPQAQRIAVKDPARLPLARDLRRRFVQAKRSILLAVHAGPLLRPLKRPYGEDAPEYYLYAEAGCPFDCQYCFLQGWLSSPVPTIYVNREGLAEQIGKATEFEGGRLYLHAGEMADSLVFDNVTGLSDVLRDACQAHPGLTCDLRTKSDRIQRLLEGRPPDNLICSWTLCFDRALRSYDLLAPDLEARLAAMARVARAGYRVALRLDPIICEGDFEDHYRRLLQRVADVLPVPPTTLSVGSLRLTAPVLRCARTRFVRSRLFAGELVVGTDGKWRYVKPLRRRAYRVVSEQARRLWGLEPVLCMEPD